MANRNPHVLPVSERVVEMINRETAANQRRDEAKRQRKHKAYVARVKEQFGKSLIGPIALAGRKAIHDAAASIEEEREGHLTAEEIDDVNRAIVDEKHKRSEEMNMAREYHARFGKRRRAAGRWGVVAMVGKEPLLYPVLAVRTHSLARARKFAGKAEKETGRRPFIIKMRRRRARTLASEVNS